MIEKYDGSLSVLRLLFRLRKPTPAHMGVKVPNGAEWDFCKRCYARHVAETPHERQSPAIMGQ